MVYQINVDIPEIKKIAVPKVPDFGSINFTVDTSKINAVVESALENKKKVDHACLFAQLSCFKAKTVSLTDQPIELSEADHIEAQKIINKLISEGILDENNKKWAVEHGLTVA